MNNTNTNQINIDILKSIQTYMKEYGFYDGEIDGVWGSTSSRAFHSILAKLDKPKSKEVITKNDNFDSVDSKYKLSNKSLAKLYRIHPDLQKIVKLAITYTDRDFTVLEGLRTYERQKELVRKGASKTYRSRHLTGHAVDLGALDDNGKISWNWEYYYEIEKAMKRAAKELGIPIEWGGDWKTFKDGPHWQLPWSKYPK